MTVILARLCTVCTASGKLVPAVNIARNVEGLAWFECAGHGAGDHSKAFGTGLLRIHLESADDFFKRHFSDAKK